MSSTFQERRKSTRHKRNFKVRIKGQTYSGIDICNDGFSIMVTDHYINFNLNQRIDSIYITNLASNLSYCIDAVKVSSKRGARHFIYGFSIENIDPKARAKHQALVDDLKFSPSESESRLPETPSVRPMEHTPNHTISLDNQFLLNLMSASKNPQLSDNEFRQYVRQQLIKLAKNQPLN